MIVFQILVLAFLGVLVIWEVSSFLRRRTVGFTWLIRTCLWTMSGLAIAFPELVTQVALVAGIRRGADLVLYVFVLAFLATTFYFYSRHVRLQRQLTDIVRLLAIRDAERGKDDS